jgi:Na+/H+-dicarboxylate symporter
MMSVVLLVMGAVIEAVGSLDHRELGRLGVKMFFWFTFTTIIAAALGIILGNIFVPGHITGVAASSYVAKAVDQSFYDIVINFFPTNILSSMVSGNMIQVIVFSLLFGVALSVWRVQKENCQFLGLLKEFNEIILKMVSNIMKAAPIGIFALMAYTTGSVGLKVLMPLLKFLGVFGAGSVLHLTLIVVFVALYCKVSPLKVAKKLSRMTIFAFTTTSSTLTLPIQMEDSETKLGVRKKISRLVITLGMTLDSNGLAMYLALACVMLAQFYGINISIMTMVKIVILSTLTCLGTVTVPGGGLVALAMVVPSLGLPLESIALLSGIDWFAGIFRTILNVDVDTLIAMIIAKDENELDYEILNN